MIKDKLLNKIISKRRQNLNEALNKAKEARDSAPGAMESHSDTSRSQYEKLVGALEQQLKDLEETAKKINLSNKSFPLMEIGFNGEKKKFILVPEGLGGEETAEIRLLSENSPLGLQLAGKNIGDKFEFNSQQIEILKIE